MPSRSFRNGRRGRSSGAPRSSGYKSVSERSERADHVLHGVALHHTYHEHHSIVLELGLKRLRKLLCRVQVVGAVQYERRVPPKYFKSPGQVC